MQSSFFHNYINTLHQKFDGLKDGNVADYIPELFKVDPDLFGIAIVSVDGNVYQAGDTREDFSIQSISKAFNYGLALENNGIEKVLHKIDVEPSGEAFNSISLEEQSGRPKNPMINAGAIATTGLIKGDKSEQKIQNILDNFNRYVGRELEVDRSIYLSEKSTGHRNRAIAHMLKNYNIIDGEPEETLDAYFQQCSININCRDLALMGAALANDGVNPITGVRTLQSKFVPNVLSVMSSCGMYDYSGNWVYSVGMPAKSGVGGGMVAVLPGQLGIAIFSPRLDPKGNSVRGIAVCEEISKEMDWHMFRSQTNASSATIRSQYTLSKVRSKLQWTEQDSKVLDKLGERTYVFELASDLSFVSSEMVLTEVNKIKQNCDYLVIDMNRVGLIDQSVILLFSDLIKQWQSENKKVYFTGMKKFGCLERHLYKIFDKQIAKKILMLNDSDMALEFIETMLLDKVFGSKKEKNSRGLDKQSLCKDFSKEEMDYLLNFVKTQTKQKGESICKEGDDAKELFFLMSGRVSVWIKRDQQLKKRLNVVMSGSSLGESALYADKTRSADIEADSEVVLAYFKPEDLYSDTSAVAQSIVRKLFSNLSQLLLNRLQRTNNELRALIG